MQISDADQPIAQRAFLVHSLAHLLEVGGWIQAGVARRNELEAIHIALLRRALRHKKVTFGSFQWETALPPYAISRAAKRLEERGLARLRLDRADKRRRWLRITKSGADCIGQIEKDIARHVLRYIRALSEDSKRYYNFTLHVWNATRFFSPSQVATPAVYFPSDIKSSDKIGPEQRQIQRFMQDLQQEPAFLSPSPPWAIDDFCGLVCPTCGS